MEDLMELMEQAMDGIITLECSGCGSCIQTEPDGDGYCDSCQTTIKNPLKINGCI